MPKPPSESLTPREAEIMNVLWEAGPSTAEEIRAALPHTPHDSTVRTLLRVLEGKGYVGHRVRGKAYVYRATVKRASAERKALRALLERFFGGSAATMVQRLIEDEQLDPAELEALRRAAQPGKRRGGDA